MATHAFFVDLALVFGVAIIGGIFGGAVAGKGALAFAPKVLRLVDE